MNTDQKERLITTLENQYFLTGVDGDSGTVYMIDDEREKILILADGDIVQFKAGTDRITGFILPIALAVQIASEITDVNSIFFEKLKGYRKLEPIERRAKRKNGNRCKGDKSAEI